MAETFAGYVLLEALEGAPPLEVFWARRTEAPPWPARLTRLGAQATPERAHALAAGWRSLLALDHPSLVRALETGAVDGQPWLAEEVVDGIRLEAVLRALAQTGHVLPADVALEIAARLADALAHVHAAGSTEGRARFALHGAVCPAAVWLTRDGGVKLEAPRPAGDPRPDPRPAVYRAPEPGPDARDDMFGLGVLLSEMLIGGPPEPSDPDALAARCGGRPDVPDAAPGLVAELCARDPGTRPQLARLLGQRLARLAASAPSPAGLAPYLTAAVGHLRPPSPDDLAPRLLAEAHAAGLAYPPRASPGIERTGIAPRGDDARTAPRLTLPKPGAATGAPALSLPSPDGAAPPEAAGAGAGARPLLLDVSDVPTSGAQKRADGLPTWLMVTMAVLSVIGAVALTRWLLPSSSPEPPPRPDPRHATAGRPALRAPALLEVTTDPPGATVFVDSERQPGVTPMALTDVRPGQPVRVTVSRSGYRSPEPRAVTADPRRVEVRRVHFTLRPLRRLRIETTPPGAALRVEGRSTVERTPTWLEGVAEGERLSIALEKRGFMPERLDLEASTRTPTVTHVELRPAQILHVTSSPSNVSVYVDGERIGKTPIEGHPVPRGRRFELKLARPDVRPYLRRLTARGPVDRRLDVRLKRRPLSELELTREEESDLSRVSGEVAAATKAVRRARHALVAAERRMKSFEHAARLDLDELEAAKEAIETAQSALEEAKAAHETKRALLEELRAQIVERVEVEAN